MSQIVTMMYDGYKLIAKDSYGGQVWADDAILHRGGGGIITHMDLTDLDAKQAGFDAKLTLFEDAIANHKVMIQQMTDMMHVMRDHIIECEGMDEWEKLERMAKEKSDERKI